MFAWKMTRPVNLFALYSGLPLVGLGSFAVQTSIKPKLDQATSVFMTSYGNTTVIPADQWVGTDDAEGTGLPAAIHDVHGPSGLRPTFMSVAGNEAITSVSIRFTVVIMQPLTG